MSSRWTTAPAAAEEFNLHLAPPVLRRGYANSGAQSIALALFRGAARVILLGYDCSLANGVHWHGPHTRTGNPNEDTLERWRGHFQDVADYAKERGAQVLNCSRYTELECFERAALDDVLAEMGKCQALV